MRPLPLQTLIISPAIMLYSVTDQLFARIEHEAAMSDYLLPEDQQLLKRIEQREQAALTLLYQRYSTQVFSLAYRILQNAHQAEEVTQDTFLKVWDRAAHWDSDKGRFSSWLLTITRHTAIDRLRAEQRQLISNSTSLEFVPDPETERGIPHDPALQDGRMLHDLVGQLPEEQAQVIQMAFFQGLTHRELSERLNLPLGTVKTRVRLGLQKLRGLWVEAAGTQEKS